MNEDTDILGGVEVGQVVVFAGSENNLAEIIKKMNYIFFLAFVFFKERYDWSIYEEIVEESSNNVNDFESTDQNMSMGIMRFDSWEDLLSDFENFREFMIEDSKGDFFIFT